MSLDSCLRFGNVLNERCNAYDVKQNLQHPDIRSHLPAPDFATFVREPFAYLELLPLPLDSVLLMVCCTCYRYGAQYRLYTSCCDMQSITNDR